MSDKVYLRQWDLANNKPTNRVHGYSDIVAKEPGMQVIDEATYLKCLADGIAEKKAAAAERRRVNEIGSPLVRPAINQVAEAVKSEPVVAPAPVVPVAPVAEPVAAVGVAPVDAGDGLDIKTKLDLQNIIDAEGLDVKKLQNRPDLIVGIRAARAAKAAPAPAPAVPAG